jgi:glycosyltransferase auxiliary protein
VELAATAIANTVTTLLTEAQWSTVVSSPESAGDLVREALRLAPPVRLQRLVAQTDLELDATAVKAGNQIVVLTEAANRDPAAFPVPDRFDAARPADPAPLWAHGTLPTGVVAEFVRGFTATAITALARHAPALRATDPGYRRLRSPVTGTPLCRPVAAGPTGEE